MQANSEISVLGLHLTNDGPNSSGLLLLSTFFVSCWAYKGRHLSLSVRRKITANVFLFNVYRRFFILGERFFIYALDVSPRTDDAFHSIIRLSKLGNSAYPTSM